jgi:hypothetical protein
MMVSYEKLCKIRILNTPCPICRKRPEVKDSKEVVMDGKKVMVCKHHHVEEPED